MGHIYIADTDKSRLVRMDDMNGTNWTALTQSPIINGASYRFGNPAHIAFDPAGRIVVGDGNNVIRVDDMTGANWAELNVGTAVQGVSADNSGTTFVAGDAASGGPGLVLFDDITTGAGFLTSNLVGQTGGIYAIPVPAQLPAVTLVPSALPFGNQGRGTNSAPQGVTLTNFGSGTLEISKIAASKSFIENDNCGPSLPAGSACTIEVTFAPLTRGRQNGAVTISDNALGATQKILLSGTGQ